MGKPISLEWRPVPPGCVRSRVEVRYRPGPPEEIGPVLERAVQLSRLMLRLGQVFRVTLDAAGRPEADTTHTLTLALLAGELADLEAVPLDREAVVSLALVHEFGEIYAGDTNTMQGLSPEAAEEKRQREEESLLRVRRELDGSPWLLALLERYEAQACLESRFVRFLDKVLPGLTHRDNGCQVQRAAGMTLEDLRERHRQHGEDLERRFPEFPLVRALLAAVYLDSERSWTE